MRGCPYSQGQSCFQPGHMARPNCSTWELPSTKSHSADWVTVLARSDWSRIADDNKEKSQTDIFKAISACSALLELDLGLGWVEQFYRSKYNINMFQLWSNVRTSETNLASLSNSENFCMSAVSAGRHENTIIAPIPLHSTFCKPLF